MNRRSSLKSLGALALVAAHASAAPATEPFRVHQWRRDARNPVLPPGGGPFDVGCCMNPFVLTRAGEYWLYYAGADRSGARRICLATCPVDDVSKWKRHGPLFDLGAKGSFDETWWPEPPALIQRHPASLISRHVEVHAVVARRLAEFESPRRVGLQR